MASRNYKYYQPNDKDLKDQYGDCVVRALTKMVTWKKNKPKRSEMTVHQE